MSLTRTVTFTVYGVEAVCCLACTSFDLAILLHLSFVQKKKGFCYVLALSASCFLGLLFWALVPAYELNVFQKTYAFLYYRCLVYAWLDNTFFCANAYIIVTLCLDRFVALYRPHSYYVWTKLGTRWAILAACFSLAVAVTSKWYGFVVIDGSYENGTAHCSENVNYTHTRSYKIGKNIAILLQYYSPAVAMIALTSLNVCKVRRLKLQYTSDLRMDGLPYAAWLRRWGRMTKISIGLATIFCLTNLPFSVFEFDFREEAYTKFGFKVFQFATNVLQIFSSQINIVLVCYYSKAYRNTARCFVTKIFVNFKLLYRCCCRPFSGIVHSDEYDMKTLRH